MSRLRRVPNLGAPDLSFTTHVLRRSDVHALMEPTTTRKGFGTLAQRCCEPQDSSPQHLAL